MNCCKSLPEEEKEERRIHRRNEKQLNKNKSVIKLLLLGTHESGKTTFVNQMRIINKIEFSVEEKEDFIKIIHQNMFTSMQAMIKGMDLLKINYYNPEIMDSVQLVHVDSSAFDEFNVNAFKKLWAFEGIQGSYRQRRLYQLTDSTDYFFSNIDRVTAKNYLPTNDDILRAHVETKGIQEYDFRVKKYNIRITDNPGKRSQRPKWFELFEKCSAMIFLSAISEYDQMLMEDEKVNRLQDSIKLFKCIINHCIFKNKPNILFLNKNDLLEKKIPDSNLADYFPEYEGPPRDVIAARIFIEKMFVDQKEDPDVVIYPFLTCATDTKNIRRVFDAAKSIIVGCNLSKCSLY